MYQAFCAALHIVMSLYPLSSAWLSAVPLFRGCGGGSRVSPITDQRFELACSDTNALSASAAFSFLQQIVILLHVVLVLVLVVAIHCVVASSWSGFCDNCGDAQNPKQRVIIHCSYDLRVLL